MENTPKQWAEQYEQGIQKARQRFNENPAIRRFTSPQGSDEMVALFLINFCSFGVGMTKPVESWIFRVGDRCEEIGLQDVGTAFKRHALQKANHHLLQIADLKSLTAYWNERFHAPHLVAEKLLERTLPPGVLAYQKLHEGIIAGTEPYRQFAVEYEVDRLSLEYGAWIVRRCIQRFGKAFLPHMTFFQKDVSLDVTRTQFNWLALGELLSAHPTFLNGLVEAGTNALTTYQQFLTDCIVDAENTLKTSTRP